MDRHEALRLAGEAVTARQTKYGSPEDNFNRIARRWNAHLANLGITDDVCVLTAADVAIMMADVKLARLANDPTHADSWVDIAGYGACGAEVAAKDDIAASYSRLAKEAAAGKSARASMYQRSPIYSFTNVALAQQRASAWRKASVGPPAWYYDAAPFVDDVDPAHRGNESNP